MAQALLPFTVATVWDETADLSLYQGVWILSPAGALSTLAGLLLSSVTIGSIVLFSRSLSPIVQQLWCGECLRSCSHGVRSDDFSIFDPNHSTNYI